MKEYDLFVPLYYSEVHRSNQRSFGSSRANCWITKRTRRRPPAAQFAVCIDNSQYPASLELNKIYRVLPDAEGAKDGDLRVVDESEEDYLYPAEWFVPIEPPSKVKSSVLRAT